MKNNKIKKHIIGIIVCALIAFGLALSFFGGEKPQKNTEKPVYDQTVQTNIQKESKAEKKEKDADKKIAEEKKSESTKKENTNLKEEDPQEKQEPPKNEEIPALEEKNTEKETSVLKTENSCLLSVRCDTILQNKDMLDKAKTDIVPENGVIYEEKRVTFNEGETVFDVLLREMRQNKIHFEFVNTPVYNSAYIEGIANLYEFDCGELSGWMYKVNGVFPSYGCSLYKLKNNDKIEWVYTCNLGKDVGNG